MAKSTLDFFPTEKETSPKPPAFQRRRSFRDIQEVTSKINPEILKSVIANASVPNTPREDRPVCDATLRLGCGFGNNNAEKIPMTIFYNGKVSVYNMSQHKAQEILKLAKEAVSESNLLETADGDLPLKRKRSLLRFLEKRQERLASASPY